MEPYVFESKGDRAIFQTIRPEEVDSDSKPVEGAPLEKCAKISQACYKPLELYNWTKCDGDS